MALDNNIKKLGILLQAMEEDHLSRQDFDRAFKKLADTVAMLKREFEQTVVSSKDELGRKTEGALKQVEEKTRDTLNQMETLATTLKNEVRSDARTTMRLLNDRLDEVMDSLPEEYDDSELREQLSGLAEKIDAYYASLPQEYDPTEILKEHEKIRKDIEELRNRPTGTGGGVTNARIAQAFKYILKTEEPVGDIDGANTTYTLSQPIFAILSMSLNGEVVAQLPNYTISGNTFTLSEAFPAAYSEKDFEVKYI